VQGSFALICAKTDKRGTRAQYLRFQGERGPSEEATYGTRAIALDHRHSAADHPGDLAARRFELAAHPDNQTKKAAVTAVFLVAGTKFPARPF
jgi:hypothetical protein